MAKKTRGFISPYRHYMFKDKDPIIDFMRTRVEDSNMSYRDISAESGVSKSTLYNWFHGKTRRPSFSTAAETLLTLGVNQINIRGLLRSNGK